MNIPIAKVELSSREIEAAIEVLKSGNLRQGKVTEEFEHSFADKVGSQYAVAVSSGTAALHLAYLSLLKSGSEVLVPTFTFIATASMVSFSNAKPIFCDVDSRTFTIDVKDAEKKLTRKTSAIAPVHLFGNSCEIDEIKDFAEDNDLRIIWDAAQAHGTKYKGRDVGSFGNVVCYSFYPAKNMCVGEGGMITTDNQELYEHLKLLRSHGAEGKYYHTILGLNYRMTDVEAAIGIGQLTRLDELVRKRRKNARYLTEKLSSIDGITVPLEKKYVEHSYNQYCILIGEGEFSISRDELQEKLKKKGMSTGIHYPRCLHQQPIFKKLFPNVSLPIGEELAKRILALPVWPGLKQEELEYIVTSIKEAPV